MEIYSGNFKKISLLGNELFQYISQDNDQEIKRSLKISDIKTITFIKNKENIIEGPFDINGIAVNFEINFLDAYYEPKIKIRYETFRYNDLVKLIKKLIKINPDIKVDKDIKFLLNNKIKFIFKKTWQEISPNLYFLGILYEILAIFILLQGLN